ncbi:MAG: serine/threonine protein kinase [Gammaproteobacteria bacterium]|jgi:serine/threonine protein kinase
MSFRPSSRRKFRARQRLGKYRIEAHIAQGGFAEIYRAYDTIEGIQVALKIPQDAEVTPAVLEDFEREVRLTAKLDHPNVLPVKDASYIDGTFTIVSPLGTGTLQERLRTRLSNARSIDYLEQVLAGVAHAHGRRVMHCDVKPDNLILFPDNRLRLSDFGISRVAYRTMNASGSGTVGYMAPEQAMGRPSFRSDVFSLGLTMTRILSAKLPTWPFEWPQPGLEKMRKKAHPDLVDLIRRAVEINPKNRWADAQVMHTAYLAIQSEVHVFACTETDRRKKA